MRIEYNEYDEARSGSPTLTEPDHILPDHDNVSISSSSPEQVLPPSPSYLMRQRYKDHQVEDEHAKNGRAIDGRQRKSQRSRNPRTTESHIRTVSVVKASPEFRYSDVALGSSPTVGSAMLFPRRKASLIDHGRKPSATPTAITNADWEAVRMPSFAVRGQNGDDCDDTKDFDDADLESATSSERWHAGDQIEPPETEESAVTLMRAEMILANAKKRLNLMDQNLRGAREMVVPLTAANLRRISHSQMSRYTTQGSSDTKTNSDSQRHYRVFSDPSVPIAYQGRANTPIGQNAIPIANSTPSWTSNPLRGSKSQELPTSSDGKSLATDDSVNMPMGVSRQREATNPKTTPSHPKTVRSHPSTASLREQMDELKGRISVIKERAREDNLKRRSLQSLRQTSNTAMGNPPMQPRQQRSIDAVANGLGAAFSPTKASFNPSPPGTDDGELVFDPALGYAALSPRSHSGWTGSEHEYETASSEVEGSTTSFDASEAESDYTDAPQEPSFVPRHEDRDDAFDYSNFFLHSSMGTFSRPRSASVTSSTDSAATARGPNTVGQVAPATPETPAALREIERNMYNRSRSADSIATVETFETAREEVHGGDVVASTIPIGEWMSPKSQMPRSSTALDTDRADADQTAEGDRQATATATTKTTADARRSQMESRMSTVSLSSSNHRESSRMSSRMSNHRESNSRTSHRMSSRMSSRLSQHTFPSIPPSATSIAVSALIDPNGRRLGLKDKAVVYTVLENVRQICEKLQTEDEKGSTVYLLRQRLEDARKVLDGSTTRLAL